MVKSKSAIKIRKRWKINPQTRIKESAKRYSRRRAKEAVRGALKEVANNANKKTAKHT